MKAARTPIWKAGDFVKNTPGLCNGPTEPAPGWKVDEDWWHWRPLRPADTFNRDGCISGNMFTEHGRVYCRDAEQAAKIDAGKVV